MCLALAKKLNLFNRDPSKITKADVCATYLFIITFLSFLIIYTHSEYRSVNAHINDCEYTKNNSTCIKTEMIRIIPHYTTIVYVSFLFLYKVLDMSSLLINLFCCCMFCCSKEKNTNEVDINMNVLNI